MYTPEQVEDQAERVGIVSENCTLTRDMLRAYAATLKAAQGGVTEAFNWTEFWNRISQSFSSKCVDEVYACYEAGKRAALSAEPAAQGEVVACIDPRHLALLRKDWRQGNCLKHPEDAVAGDVLLYTAPPAQPAERVPDGWKLAMFVLQSGLYAKLPEEERAVCDALVAENPYINTAATPAPAEDGKEGVR